MLSVGAVPPTEEAIKFHMMPDCSSVNVERRRGGEGEAVVGNLNALSQYLLAQIHTHTHARTQSSFSPNTLCPAKQPDLICQVHLLP